MKAASFADGLPLTRIRLMRFTVEGEPTPKHGSEPTADMRGISSPSYFETMGMSLVRGRNFTADEINQKSSPLIVVNQACDKALARSRRNRQTYLERSRPSRKIFSAQLTVIGVVGDTRQMSVESATRPEVTRPMQDYTYRRLRFAARRIRPC